MRHPRKRVCMYVDNQGANALANNPVLDILCL